MRKYATLSFVVGFALVALAGCAGHDLKVLCETATEAQLASVDPAYRSAIWARNVDDRLSRFGDVRKAFQALAVADPSQRYQLLKQAAAETGHPEWECPAIEAMISGR